jgi:hypothetical protein
MRTKIMRRQRRRAGGARRRPWLSVALSPRKHTPALDGAGIGGVVRQRRGLWHPDLGTQMNCVDVGAREDKRSVVLFALQRRRCRHRVWNGIGSTGSNASAAKAERYTFYRLERNDRP